LERFGATGVAGMAVFELEMGGEGDGVAYLSFVIGQLSVVGRNRLRLGLGLGLQGEGGGWTYGLLMENGKWRMRGGNAVYGVKSGITIKIRITIRRRGTANVTHVTE